MKFINMEYQSADLVGERAAVHRHRHFRLLLLAGVTQLSQNLLSNAAPANTRSNRCVYDLADRGVFTLAY
ncbi:hypothetical protein [Devosia sp.]|uniref:hypothetical protein n=1 Tax=Devosia sp. TaxID=1871048 RepID=UPI0032657BB8